MKKFPYPSSSSLLFILFILFILFSFFYFFGCVQTNVYPSEPEKIERMAIEDTDKDGIPDKYFYEFQPKKIADVSLKRTLLSTKTEKGYNVSIVLTLIVEKPGGMKNVYINEKIPFSVNLEEINFETKYSKVIRKEIPILVSWEYSFSGGERIVKNIIYSTTILSEPTKACVEKNVFSSEIKVESYEFLLFENLKKIHTNLLSLFTSINFYLGIGVYGGFLFLIFLIALEIFSLFAAFVSSLVKRKKFWDEVYKWIGRGRKENLVWIVGSIVLLFLGAIISVVPKEIEGSEKLGTIERLGSNAINSFGTVIFIFGEVFLIYIVFDALKGKIYGERYFLSEFDVLKGKIKIGFEKLKKLEEKISACNSMNLDTSTESIIHSIEEKRLKKIYAEINEENYEIYAPIVSKSISDIDSAIDGLTTKMEINENWKEWERKIEDILIKKEEVNVEDLTFIPSEWRKWALSKYYGEHLGEALTLKGDTLSRMKIVSVGKGEIERILSDFMGCARMEGTAIVRKDGLIIASKIRKDIDNNLVAAIAAKLVGNAEMVSHELDKGSVSSVILRTKEGDTLISSGEKIILISLISAGENTGYVMSEAEKVIEKLNNMLK
ncbi:MAG: roadblock/LC7 domain-containing protein [Candidatus Micrarchaeia archaeon]